MPSKDRTECAQPIIPLDVGVPLGQVLTSLSRVANVCLIEVVRSGKGGQNGFFFRPESATGQTHVSERSRSHPSQLAAVISDEMRTCSLARVMNRRGGPLGFPPCTEFAAVAVLLRTVDCVGCLSACLWISCCPFFPLWTFVRRFVWSILGESFGCDVPDPELHFGQPAPVSRCRWIGMPHMVEGGFKVLRRSRASMDIREILVLCC